MEPNIQFKDVTKEMIAEWKKQHGEDNLFKYDVEDKNGNPLHAICMKPTRRIISYSSAVSDDAMKSNKLLVDGCWLAGDEIIKTDDGLFLGLTQKLSSLYKPVVGELVKL